MSDLPDYGVFLIKMDFLGDDVVLKSLNDGDDMFMKGIDTILKTEANVVTKSESRFRTCEDSD